jgi:hypothetical protein
MLQHDSTDPFHTFHNPHGTSRRGADYLSLIAELETMDEHEALAEASAAFLKLDLTAKLGVHRRRLLLYRAWLTSLYGKMKCPCPEKTNCPPFRRPDDPIGNK